ncbi:MAG: hypothetical protein NTX25_00150, partial [Proteobacteria bacterium]|nr:hypothetical protein [Pseudomonadota bacterium]
LPRQLGAQLKKFKIAATSYSQFSSKDFFTSVLTMSWFILKNYLGLEPPQSKPDTKLALRACE